MGEQSPENKEKANKSETKPTDKPDPKRILGGLAIKATGKK